MSELVNPHDKLFRALLDDPIRAETLIREYLPPALRDRLADARPELVDGTFVDARLRGSQSDRLFQVRLKSGKPLLLYVLLEHKSTPDPGTPIQLLGYSARIWERYGEGRTEKLRALPPIIPLVFYHGSAVWQVPASVIDCLDTDPEVLDLVRDFRYVLHDLKPIAYERLSAERALRAGLAALKFAFERGLPLADMVRMLEDLPDGGMFEKQFFEYVVAVYDMPVQTLLDAVALAKPEREEILVTTIAQQWVNQGEMRGRAQGIKEGEAQGQRKAILLALETRFGDLDIKVRAHVAKIPDADLDVLLRRVLTASTLEGVFDDSQWH
ncbi:Rpn family recombination-promoting nuclease/putative transposase [Candidatus Thiodictyon syntrophicum]|jgi:hypothetical protein|uniref:Transposase (putative) YhgA-like domain-containing protein n=1 Tax=Candidatus Thiodictyon syntrophicum TaxID=1166950 RepID=A0A2K8U2U5_9GAMM|nr:Rpn family recombination-promoting nuclease/putative transposase [Candidatus Thiodictyon syntrophicum]AUB79904.1 hypothetical protein THSYN_02290 [Candidatus Thiodictyon syntrophicum]